MKKNLLTIGLAAIILSVFSVTGFAGQKGHGGHGHGKYCPKDGRHGHFKQMFNQLDLTDAQKADIKTIMDAHRDKADANRQQMMAARKSINEMVHGSVFDEAALRKAIQDAAGLKEEMIVDRAKGFQEIRGLLTETQIAKFDKLHKQKMERFEKRMKPRFDEDI